MFPADENVWKGNSASNKSGFNGPIVGIDFGTSNSCICAWHTDKNHVKTFKNFNGERITASIIGYDFDNECFVIGNDKCSTNTDFIGGLKNLLRNENAVDGNDSPVGLSQFETVVDTMTNSVGERMIVFSNKKLPFDTKEFSLPFVISQMLGYLRRAVEKKLESNPMSGGGAITEAVLGVPVHFPEMSKNILREAADFAGFKHIHFLQESTAAALAFGLQVVCGTEDFPSHQFKKNVCVFDMGGGTTDLTIVSISNNGYCTQVQHAVGHPHCGGQNMDALLLDHLLKRIIQIDPKNKMLCGLKDYTTDNVHLLSRRKEGKAEDGAYCHRILEKRRKLLNLCRLHKEALSNDSQTTIFVKDVLKELDISIASLKDVVTSEGDSCIKLNRREFESLIVPVTDLVENLVAVAMQQWQSILTNNSSSAEVDGQLEEEVHEEVAVVREVVLVGGCTHVLSVQQALRRGLGRYFTSVAACHPADVIHADASLPVVSVSVTGAPTLSNKEFCSSVNVEEVVAEGLALRGAILNSLEDNGKVDINCLKGMILMDVMPTSIGIMVARSASYAQQCVGSGGQLSRRVYDHGTNLDDNTPQYRSFMPFSSQSSSASDARSPHSDSLQEDSVRDCMYFDPILFKGGCTPGSERRRFLIPWTGEDGCVSLELFEEVCTESMPDLVPVYSPEGDVMADGVGLSSGHVSNDMTSKFTYNILGSFDVPIEDPEPATVVTSTNQSEIYDTPSQDEDAFMELDIILSMSGNGKLRYAAQLSQHSAHVRNVRRNQRNKSFFFSLSSTTMLLMYCGLLFVMYLVIKLGLIDTDSPPDTNAVPDL